VLVSSQTGATIEPSMLVYEATKRAKETSQRVRLCAKTTKETSLPPIVGLRPIVVSRPTRFAEVRQDDCNEASTNSLPIWEHAGRHEFAQSTSGGAYLN